MSYLVIEKVSKRFAQMDHPALSGISFALEDEEILALVGESGSGKTTISRIIAGFEVGDSGSVVLGDRTLWSPEEYIPPEQRKIGYVFQENTLFPHLTVEQNISFGLESYGAKAKRAGSEHVRRLVAMTGLEGMERRYPHELSGGQAQRVALVRALAPKPKLLILDEPFNNLDVSLKTRVVRETAEILRESAIPAILVTHRPEEAFAVADRMAVIRAGAIIQEGTPDHLYHYPVDRTVAEFFGPINRLPAHREEGLWHTPFGPVPEEAVRNTPNGPVAFLRPESFELATADDRRTVACTVRRVTSFGSHYEVLVKDDTLPDPLIVWAGTPPDPQVRVGIHLRRKISK